jgi:hypothetical protein
MEKQIQEKLAQLLIDKGIVKDRNFGFFTDTKQQEKLSQLFIQKGITKDLADYNAMWQNALADNECMEMLGGMIKDTAKEDKDLVTFGDYVKALSQKRTQAETKKPEADKSEQLKKEALYYGEEFKKSLEMLKKLKSERISQHYFILQEYAKLLVKADKIFGLLVEGSTGRGKTFQILNSVLGLGLKLNEDFVVLTTYVTPLEFYHFCYNNKDKLIIVDDVPQIFNDRATIGVILSFLWSATAKRTVEWHSTTNKLKVPSQFNPEGKLIIVSNRIPEAIATVKSRCLNYSIEFTHSEILELIYEVCKVSRIPLEIADFIRDNTDMTTSDDVMNLRLPIKLYEIDRHNKENWQELCKAQLNCDKEITILKEILFSGLSKVQQIKEFYERTGRHRSTFYRWKERIEREFEYQKLAKSVVAGVYAKEKQEATQEIKPKLIEYLSPLPLENQIKNNLKIP